MGASPPYPLENKNKKIHLPPVAAFRVQQGGKEKGKAWGLFAPKPPTRMSVGRNGVTVPGPGHLASLVPGPGQFGAAHVRHDTSWTVTIRTTRMRFDHLALVRYGHFNDRKLEFPRHETDFHLILGRNEAGKSTLLAALEDFLFTIPARSPYNFRHAYGDMEIAATIQHDGATTHLHRRKGTRNTLRNNQDGPVAEQHMRVILGGASREFFSRIFCLNHQRLRAGGQEILAGKNETGQMLFAAAAGMIGLRQRAEALHDSAASLWTPRRAKDRAFYVVKDRLDAANQTARDIGISIQQWQKIGAQLRQSEARYDELNGRIQREDARLRQLARIRRVWHDLRRLDELEITLAELQDVVDLREDAADILASAEKNDISMAAALKIQEKSLHDALGEQAELSYDSRYLDHQAELELLREERIKVRSGENDLLNRHAELDEIARQMHELADELGWPRRSIDELLAKLPKQAALAAIRAHAQKHSGLVKAGEVHKETLVRENQRLAELTQNSAVQHKIYDTSLLAASLDGLRKAGDVLGLIAKAEEEQASQQVELDRLGELLSGLASSADPAKLAAMILPDRTTCQESRDIGRDLEQAIATGQDRLEAVENQMVRLHAEQHRLVQDGAAVSGAELSALRTRRDQIWQLVRRQYVAGEDVAPHETQDFLADAPHLVDSYEISLRVADVAADRRYQHAEAAARLTELTERLAEQQAEASQLQTEQTTRQQRQEKWRADWAALWDGLPIQPTHPDNMLAWLESHAVFTEHLRHSQQTGYRLAQLRQQERDWCERLRQELQGVEIKQGDKAGLAVIRELAEQWLRDQKNFAAAQQQLGTQLAEQQRDIAEKSRLVEQSRTDLVEWQQEWQRLCALAGLDTGWGIETIDVRLTIIGNIRENAVKYHEIRVNRIDKIHRDTRQFAEQTRELAAILCPDQPEGQDANDTALELVRHLDTALQMRVRHGEYEKTIAALRQNIRQHQIKHEQTKAEIGLLMRQAGITDEAALPRAIERSGRKRAMRRAHEDCLAKLRDDGDGLALDKLRSECTGIESTDILAAEEKNLTDSLPEQREALLGADRDRVAARQEFDDIGGDSAMAEAEADRQAALTEMTSIASRYVRERGQALLLQWAIDRFQREKQAPMLQQAGEIFARLTDGAFTALILSPDDNDELSLNARRDDNQLLALSGMSEGTADQLYLALRIAAALEYLGNAPPLPFIADDLFIQFDDIRAQAGFRVLADFAKKTQTLFFTHHPHLADMAVSCLGDRVNRIDL